jgi:1-pyrroline-5-carboxylate dehydrogenase
MSGNFQVPLAENEPVLSYEPGTPERDAVKAKLAELSGTQIDIPLIIGGKEVRTGNTGTQVIPHRHGHVLATWHKAGPNEVKQAIKTAVEAWEDWSTWSFEARASVFLRAAELLATTWRQTINAATMLNQSKTVHQAEIDAACELIDFLRFNVEFASRLYDDQPISSPGVWNRLEYRPLEGFVYAVTPFNFTSIGGNLPSAPALMGCTSLWKPSSLTVYSNYYIAKLFEAAGLPPGVINFIPGSAAEITDVVLADPSFAGIHFTGSTDVFRSLWKTAATNLPVYKSYPRLVGETGGKDFIIAHPSAEPESLMAAIVRGSFEYQGQKCSAASRAYIPESLWKRIEQPLLEMTREIAMGDVADFRNFMGAVIGRNAFDDIKGYIDHARNASDAKILVGGETDDSEGYFIRPTIIRADKPDFKSMCEEIFGPVLSLYVYPDGDWERALELVDTSTPYGLTGAVFAEDRRAVADALGALRYAAGNFYINDKPTGAVVGQQPFGGGRASGTNDKAGALQNLMRWVSTRTIKETFVPPTDYRYGFMDEA